MGVEDSSGNGLGLSKEHKLKCPMDDEECAGKEVAIQTNPHEIERNRGQLPLRKRFVPVRFSDYGVFADNVKEEEEDPEVLEDTDFIPRETVAKQTPNSKDNKQKRTRGRPRKNTDATTVSASGESEVAKLEAGKRNPITKVSNGFKCGICSKVFTLRGNAKTHLITHTDERPFPCDFKGCGKSLRTKEGLRRHRLSHLGVKTFECGECNKKFSCNLSLVEHMSRHTGLKPLNCKICGTNFRQIAVLNRHLTTHSNDKPFACEVCGKTFSLKVYVRSHMKTHTGERPFACDVCNKCFAHASDLNRHKIIHSGKKPYQCSVCPMRYSDPSSRRRHEREHENKPQCVCHVCHQKFAKASQLRLHLVQEHTMTPVSSDQPPTSVIPYHIKIEPSSYQNGKVSSITWGSGVDSSTNSGAKVVSIPPAALSHTATSTDAALGQDMNTVQIVLDSTSTGQIDTSKDVLEGGVVGEVQAIQDGGRIQTVVMELPQNTDHDFPPPTTYKVINTDNQVFEIQVEKPPSQIPFEIHDIRSLNSEMKINPSDLKATGRLVALVQNGDTVTLMEQAEDADTPQPSNNSNGDNDNNNIDFVVESIVDESNTIIPKDVGTFLEDRSNGVLVVEDTSTSVVKETEESLNADSFTISDGQQENLIVIQEGPAIVDMSNNSDATVSQSQADSTMPKTYPPTDNNDSGNQQSSSIELSSQEVPIQSVDVMNNDNLQDISSTATNVESTKIPESFATTAILSHFIESPDLSSQDYYNWLSSFSEECKHLAMPLSKDIFTKISHVQKTLADFMALPTGVITDKNNFKILLSITQDLALITSSHLSFMYSNLNS